METGKKAINKEKKSLSMLTSMLIMFFAALSVCVILTVILFSFMGRSVYTKLIMNEMLTQADLLADEAVKLIDGEISYDSFGFMLRSIESKVVMLGTDAEPISYFRDKNGAFLPDALDGPGRNDDIDAFCRSALEDVIAYPEARFVRTDKQSGIVVASLIIDDDDDILGAVFLIRPMADITAASHSLLFTLVVSSALVGLIMLVPLYFMVRWLTRPVERLTSAASELSGGNYGLRVEPNGSLEVCELGATFNSLAENLQENIGELTVERNRLSAILDGMQEGIIGFDTHGAVLKYNSSAARLLGGSDCLPQDERVFGPAKRVLETDEGCSESFTVGKRAIRVSITPIYEEKGRLAGAVALLMDVTEAERLEQTRRDYVANVSHELRTPLASIRSIADMLNDGLVRNEDDRFRYYGYILKESIRLSKLINDLLELSRLQSGRIALKLSRVELYELIADVADRMTDPAREQGMTVDLTVPEGKYFANSNPDRVEQVLVTLMDNAVKHGTEGGTITVRLGENAEKWLISVENPAEIEQEDVEHLFERFYKADKAHTGEGTGLGLAITEEVLELLGETISVNYENGIIVFTFTVSKKL